MKTNWSPRKNKKNQKVQKVKEKAKTKVEEEALRNLQKQNQKLRQKKNQKKFSDWANIGKAYLVSSIPKIWNFRGCWWRMLKTVTILMLGTFLAISVTSTTPLLTLASSTNIKKMSPRSYFCRQHSKIVTNWKSPTSQCHQHDCSFSKSPFLLANPGKLIRIFLETHP